MSNVSQATLRARQARHDARMAAARVVPHGSYCYSLTGRMRTQDTMVGADGAVHQVAPYSMPEIRYCPFLKFRGDWPEQANGFCRLTQMGDSAKHPPLRDGLLWDACKSCGVNPDDDTP